MPYDNGNPYPPMPEGQKCMRHLENFSRTEDEAPLAVKDYNGCGYFVCQPCLDRLNDEFDAEYY